MKTEQRHHYLKIHVQNEQNLFCKLLKIIHFFMRYILVVSVSEQCFTPRTNEWNIRYYLEL